ncbi:signal peptide peptidase SppA [Aeoliella sp. ICT_H6.2]|uniref:Signal peptide peptidase SppA n=1 Tax=Aeoliella straminimaris TaxID=2954799 RepID=A0A9X2F7Y4_9BACT|nr:signal peptide peptidase SppA [Aeoliella straminimaris]MCO6044015.1 signal peptide peptidase SppA [Aeoliella straminimaris]
MSTAEPTPNSPQIVIQQKESLFGRYGKFLVAALVFCILVIVSMRAAYDSYFNLTPGPTEKFLDGDQDAVEKIAVIDISGTISEADTFVKEQIDRVRKDENVVGVVLRINSPGGTVTYSDYLHHKLRELAEGTSREGKGHGKKLDIVVSMGSVCASGGYYLASAVGNTKDSIYAEPATITGSIGVIIPHYDFSELLGEWHIKDDSIMSAPLKDMGSPTKKMTPEEREIFQTLVDEMLAEFKKKIQEGRPAFQANPEDLDAVATGQVFTAQQAEELGLVDKIGFIEDALDRAAVLAGKKDRNGVRCVKYEKPPVSLSTLLGSASAAEKPAIDLSSLNELASPKAYYLYTWVPGITE